MERNLLKWLIALVAGLGAALAALTGNPQVVLDVLPHAAPPLVAPAAPSGS